VAAVAFPVIKSESPAHVSDWLGFAGGMGHSLPPRRARAQDNHKALMALTTGNLPPLPAILRTVQQEARRLGDLWLVRRAC